MKTMIACALALSAIAFSSCGDTNRCYEVTVKTNVLVETSVTYLWWGTKNDLKAYEASLKENLKNTGIDESVITVSSKPTAKSKDECHK